MVEMFMCVFIFFPIQGFIYVLSYSDPMISIEDLKRCLNAMTLNLSCAWACWMPIFWVFMANTYAKMCVKKSEQHEKKY